VPTVAYEITWDLGAGFVAMPGALGAEVELQMTEGNTGLGWGSAAVPRASIRATAATVDAAWSYRPVKVRVSVDGGAYQDLFTGPLLEQNDDGISLVYTAGGMDVIIQRAPIRTPVRRRRPIATLTTALTNEDPDSGSPGWINEVFWRAGGRPWDQRAFYPLSSTVTFYYACQGSSVAPSAYCVDGDNAWESLLLLAEAGAGQIYQDAAGTMHFVNPLSFGESALDPPHLIDGPNLTPNGIPYGRLSRSLRAEGVISTAHAPFKVRGVQVMQQVYEDKAAYDIAPSAFRDFELAMQWPIATHGAVTTEASTAQGVSTTVTPTVLATSGMRRVIRVTNPSGTVGLIVHRIATEGEPVSVVSEGTASFTGSSVGPFPAELRLPSNDAVQTYADARRWARMAVRFFNTPRPVYTLTDLPYSPALLPGVYAELTSSRRGLSAIPVRITRVQIERSGAKISSLSCVPLTGLPKLSDFFIIGTTYADGTTRKYGY
jgi:hypothetical protein